MIKKIAEKVVQPVRKSKEELDDEVEFGDLWNDEDSKVGKK
jgi:hypothetical protein